MDGGTDSLIGIGVADISSHQAAVTVGEMTGPALRCSRRTLLAAVD
jgi:hypothetical protein